MALAGATPEAHPSETAAETAAFARWLKHQSGVVTTPERIRILEKILHERCRKLGSPRAYLDWLRDDEAAGEERRELLDTLLVHESSFWRTHAHFEALVGLLQGRRDRLEHPDPIRCWSAGCADGCEPYTLAMALAEAFPKQAPERFEILATDASEGILGQARKGRFHPWVLRHLPPPLRERYLRPLPEEPETLEIEPLLRKMIVFERHNLVADPFPNGLDALLCRNVLIYFDADTRRRVLDGFYRSLVPGGILVLGPAESTLESDLGFDLLWMGETLVYRKPKREEAPARRSLLSAERASAPTDPEPRDDGPLTLELHFRPGSAGTAETFERLKHQLVEIIRSSAKKVAIVTDGIEWLDKEGLHLLGRAFRLIHREGRGLHLVAGRPALAHHMRRITQEERIPLFSTLAEARAAFSDPRT
jgi:chemotaxis protein methyltransferase CheR